MNQQEVSPLNTKLDISIESAALDSGDIVADLVYLLLNELDPNSTTQRNREPRWHQKYRSETTIHPRPILGVYRL